MEQNERRFAVLIDADNVSPKYIKYILDEVSDIGVATYKRIYGDWTDNEKRSWKKTCGSAGGTEAFKAGEFRNPQGAA